MYNYEVAKWSIWIYIVWSVAGSLVGAYALIKLGVQWKKISIYTKIGWVFQAAVTLFAVLFAIWTILAVSGQILQLTWQPALVLILGCILALPGAAALLSQPKPSVTSD